MEKDGKPFEFTILTNQGNESRTRCAEIIQRRVAAGGIKVKIRTVEWAAFINDFIDKKNFEAVILGWTLGQDPDLYDIWHSSKVGQKELNFISYKNPEMDSLLEKGRYTSTPISARPAMTESRKSWPRISPILSYSSQCPAHSPRQVSRSGAGAGGDFPQYG